MKKILPFLAACLSLVLLLSSCEKEDYKRTKRITLDVSVAAGTAYTLDLSPYGDYDDKAAITRQAISYTQSEIVPNSSLGVYTFLKAGAPKLGGNGKEVVEIKITGSGCSDDDDDDDDDDDNDDDYDDYGKTTIITINLTVL